MGEMLVLLFMIVTAALAHNLTLFDPNGCGKARNSWKSLSLFYGFRPSSLSVVRRDQNT